MGPIKIQEIIEWYMGTTRWKTMRKRKAQTYPRDTTPTTRYLLQNEEAKNMTTEIYCGIWYYITHSKMGEKNDQPVWHEKNFTLLHSITLTDKNHGYWNGYHKYDMKFHHMKI